MRTSGPAAIAAFSIALLSASSAAQAPAPVRVIELSSYAYAPSTIRLRAGQPVTLRFVNRAGSRHDFTARSFFGSSRILAGTVRNGEIDLGPGRQTQVTLVPAAGDYRVHCGRTFHKLLGMKARIVVE